MGLVSEVFSERDQHLQTQLSGNVGIAHTRYSTEGSKTIENSGPFVISSAIGYIALSHNGEITNAAKLKDELKKKGTAFMTTSDSEVLLMEIAKDIGDNGIVNGLRIAMSKLQGAYSCSIMMNDRLLAMRDPYGIRPLSVGRAGDHFIVASESCVFDVLEGEFIRDVKPGEVVEITPDGIETLFSVPAKATAHCMFEWVYFARPDSIIDGTEVFQSRLNIGKMLARQDPVPADVVIAVPDSGRTQALGYSMESNIPYNEGLIKNRYSDRTFIMPSQKARSRAIKLKLNSVRSVISGQRVVLVDDSIVRGNTIRHIITLLRNQGATEVHVRIGCPPIISPCYFGVDMKTKDQFLASNKTVEKIREEIGADSLSYLTIDSLTSSLGKPSDSLCVGCLTGSYPISITGEKYALQSELENY